MLELSGVLPVVATPFTQDWDIDYPALAPEIDWILANGADGITVAMVSEIQRLSSREREQLNSESVAMVNGRGAVVLSVGGESTQVAVGLARAAARAGASAVMATPPLQGAPSERELRDYLAAIIDAAGTPVILQDASSYVGVALSAEVQARLVVEFGADTLYLKPEAEPLGPTTTAILQASDGTARIFDGSGGVSLMDTWMRGIVGTMPGPDLVWAVRALWDALKGDDRSRALDITTNLSTLISMVTGLDGYVAFEKYMLVKQGVLGSARMRGPVFYSIDDVTAQLLDALFERLRTAVQN